MTMFERSTCLVIAAGVVAFAVPRSFAEDQPSAAQGRTTQGEPASGTRSESNELTGRVEGVDRSNGTVRVAGKTLRIATSTSVTRGGIGVEASTLREGDQVRASFSGSGDTLKAERIDVTSPSQAPTGTPAR